MAFRKTDHPGISVYKRDNGTLLAEWIDPDTQTRRRESLAKLGFNTKTQAAEWLRARSRELLNNKFRVNQTGRREGIDASWNEIEAAYLDDFAANHGVDSGERLRKFWLSRFRDFMDRLHVRTGGQLSSRHLTLFRGSLAKGKSPLAPATRNRILGSVKAMLSWARRAKYLRLIEDDIRDSLGFVKVPEHPARVLNREEIKRLLKAVVEHDGKRHFASRSDKAAYFKGQRSDTASGVFKPLSPFVLIGLLTGARPGEVLRLKWDDVDFQSNEIRVWGSKTQRERVVPMHDSPALRELLTALKLRSGGSIHVCGDWEEGKATDIHHRQWSRLMKLGEIKSASQKVLRSTCVAHVASASTDSEYLLEARFGHGAEVSKKHYRRPLHGLAARGETVEEWLGVKVEIREAMAVLGFTAAMPKQAKAEV